MMDNNPHTPLLKDISQYEVDFVIPQLGADLPIGIDPFLLYKSRDPSLNELHEIIIEAFNKSISFIKNNNLNGARQILAFPEVAEIGFGYSKKSKKGRGIGNFLGELIVQTLVDSPLLVERGVRHIEEIQLFSFGIGADRISDMIANLIKHYLIEYTQKQCRTLDIPLVSAPIEHVFEIDNLSWHDGYFDLPISSYDKKPMLFVPRRIVRTLPWINYEDYYHREFSAYLRARRTHNRINQSIEKTPESKLDKDTVIEITRREIERVDRYIKIKEDAAADAQPTLAYIDPTTLCSESNVLKARIEKFRPGREDASLYQRTMLETLNFLFNPELIDGELEVETIDGTERRDIIFTNDSDQTFWSYIRIKYSSLFIMFEVKNTSEITNFYLNQVATYLGERLGYVGFIITRTQLQEAQTRKTYSIHNDGRKIILVLSDTDIFIMLDMKCSGRDPMEHIRKVYRKFMTNVQ